MKTHDLDELKLPPGEASRRAIRFVVPVALVMFVAGAAFWGWTRIALNQEHELPPLYETTDVTVEGVNWGHVHSELIPAWLMDAGSGQPTGNALTQLRGELAGVPAMLNAMERMAGSVNALSVAEGIDQRRQAVDDWNEWLSANGVPLLLRLPSNPRWQSTYLLSYYRLAQVTVHAADTDIDVAIDTRVDQLNLREGYAGHTTADNEDIVVLVDRIADSAMTSLWPLLDKTASGDLQGIAPDLAARVRAEISTAVGAEAANTLSDTAGARLALVETLRAINDRQSCGGDLLFQEFPILGFSRQMLDELDEVTEPAGTVCPDITNDEVSDLRRASAALRGTRGLFDALQRLNAFAAIEVAVHESAHALRNLQAESASCVDCPFGARSASAHEYDAFLAALSHEGIEYSSLAMMCQLMAGEQQNQHTQAIAHVLQRVGYADCEGAVPEGLAESARDVRHRDLASDAVFIVDGMPERIRPMFVR